MNDKALAIFLLGQLRQALKDKVIHDLTIKELGWNIRDTTGFMPKVEIWASLSPLSKELGKVEELKGEMRRLIELAIDENKAVRTHRRRTFEDGIDLGYEFRVDAKVAEEAEPTEPDQVFLEEDVIRFNGMFPGIRVI